MSFDITSNNITICEPYKCTGYRYVDLPFLDPAKDQSLIDAFFQNDSFTLAFIMEAIFFLLMTQIAKEFISVIPALAKGIAGTPFMQADVQ